MKKADPRTMIKAGFKMIAQQMAYSQIDVVRKLAHLHCNVSRASFSNVLNDRPVGEKNLRRIQKGMDQLLALELGLKWNTAQRTYLKDVAKNWSSTIVEPARESSGDTTSDLIFHAEGRVTIGHKIAFMEKAQREIIELGVRLNTFTESFTSLKENEFMMPIRRMLKRGVNMKLFMIDPDSNEARFYFNDRAKQQEEEAQSAESIKKVLRKLPKIIGELYDEEYPGHFEVYLYKNIPYNNFLILDPEVIEGRMMVSHYLYGIRRADCPVIEFSKRNNRGLFRKYVSSFRSMTRQAKKVDFSK